MITLEQYLEDNGKNQVIDFSVRAEKKDDGYKITVHPNVPGETIDFIVKANQLETISYTKPAN